MSKWWKIGAAVAGAVAYTIWDGRKLSLRKRNSELTRGKKFVVVGGGFAGSEAAAELAKEIPAGADIILVDKLDSMVFTPMLTEALGARIESHHITVLLKSFSGRVRVVKGKVHHIDINTRTVTFEDGHLAPISADHLVIALGATSNFHGIPGVEDVAYSLKTVQDANEIRSNALRLVEEAAKSADSALRQSNLTFVVAGGGYTGVEGIAALNAYVRDEVAKQSSLSDGLVRMVLVEPMKRLMSEVTQDLASYSQQQLEKAGVEIKLGAGIKSVNGDLIELTNGEQIRAKTLIWTAGVKASPLVSEMGAPTGKGDALTVDSSLRVVGYENVWAIGDCAAVPKPSGKGSYAQTAQNATREGKLAAKNIVRQLRGESPQAFRYKPVGELALVGRRKGVARIYGINFSGFSAYILWRAIYLMKMPSLVQRFRVLGDWILDTTLGPVAE